MSAVFADSDATVVVALIGLVGALAALFAQNRKTHRDNRADHASVAKVVADTAAKVDGLVGGQAEIRADVRDIRSEVRSHGDRLRRLEVVPKPKPAPRPRKKAAS